MDPTNCADALPAMLGLRNELLQCGLCRSVIAHTIVQTAEDVLDDALLASVFVRVDEPPEVVVEHYRLRESAG